MTGTEAILDAKNKVGHTEPSIPFRSQVFFRCFAVFGRLFKICALLLDVR